MHPLYVDVQKNPVIVLVGTRRNALWGRRDVSDVGATGRARHTTKVNVASDDAADMHSYNNA